MSEPRWHHSPDAPPEHFCADCDYLVTDKERYRRFFEEAQQARAEADATIMALREALEHMARFRHNEAHNGDVYQGGEFPCDLCPAILQELRKP